MLKRLLFIVNDPDFFISHRLPVAIRAKEVGYEVWVATKPGKSVEAIRDNGLNWVSVPLTRSGKNPIREILAFMVVWWRLWQIRPDVLHLVTIKPVLYGGIAARLTPVKGTVAAISGLGYVFSSRGLKASLLRKAVSTCYRFALAGKRVRVIFQNPSDRVIPPKKPLGQK